MIYIDKSVEIRNALKLVLKRLRAFSKESDEDKEPKHICTNCKYRNMQEGYDQQWGRFFVVKNWCGKDRKLMDTFFNRGNDKHFSEACEYFEAGEGIYHKISKKEKKKLGIR
ncbi:MAG: hypothetical protein K1W16_13815 [Lachnospiraceae bacterium]